MFGDGKKRTANSVNHTYDRTVYFRATKLFFCHSFMRGPLDNRWAGNEKLRYATHSDREVRGHRASCGKTHHRSKQSGRTRHLAEHLRLQYKHTTNESCTEGGGNFQELTHTRVSHVHSMYGAWCACHTVTEDSASSVVKFVAFGLHKAPCQTFVSVKTSNLSEKLWIVL